MAARRSAWINCCSMRLASVISRAEAMIPSIWPEAPRSGLAVARNKRISPSLRSVKYSRLPSVDLPETSASKISRTILRSRTNKRIAALAIGGDHQVWKALDQAAREFLFAMQLQLDFAALGDVDQSSLVALNAARSVPDACRGMQASYRRAVAAAQSDLMPVNGVGMRKFALFGFPLSRMEEVFGKRMTDDFFPFFVAEHERKGGIDILEIALGG